MDLENPATQERVVRRYIEENQQSGPEQARESEESQVKNVGGGKGGGRLLVIFGSVAFAVVVIISEIVGLKGRFL